MQPAELADQLMPWPQIQMMGVGEDDFSAQFFERALRQALDRRRRAHRHEKRLPPRAVWRRQLSTTRTRRIGLGYLKRKAHRPSVSGEEERPAHANHAVSGPNRYSNRECLTALEFLGIRSREAHGQQDQCPNREEIKRLAKGHQP